MTAPLSMMPRIYTLGEIEQVTKEPAFRNNLVQAIAQGFVDFEQGNFFAAPIQTLGSPPFHFGSEHAANDDDAYAAQTCVKSGYFRNNPYYVIKVASGGHPWPQNSGLMQVYSQQTGRLLSLLLDEGILTELRTAAVGALALKLLLLDNRPQQDELEITSIGIVGTGVQARYQVRYLATVTSCRHLRVYGRSHDKALAYKEEMEAEGWDVTMVERADDLLYHCQAIVTTTSARQAILGTSLRDPIDASPFATRLIICIGADAAGKRELALGLVERASLLVADSLAQTRERGEFQAWSQKHVAPSDGKEISYQKEMTETAAAAAGLYALGKVVRDPTLVESKSDDLIIFDSSGVALQDCAVAQMVYQALAESTCG